MEKAAEQVVQTHYRNCNQRCGRKEPELGSSSQEIAEPHGTAASVSAKVLQPASPYNVVNGVHHAAVRSLSNAAAQASSHTGNPVSVNRA